MLLEKNEGANPVLFIELYESQGEASNVSHSENFNLGRKPVLQLVTCCNICFYSLMCALSIGNDCSKETDLQRTLEYLTVAFPLNIEGEL